MTNCEECAYYDYDPETDTNFSEAIKRTGIVGSAEKALHLILVQIRLGDEYRTARRQ